MTATAAKASAAAAACLSSTARAAEAGCVNPEPLPLGVATCAAPATGQSRASEHCAGFQPLWHFRRRTCTSLAPTLPTWLHRPHGCSQWPRFSCRQAMHRQQSGAQLVSGTAVPLTAVFRLGGGKTVCTVDTCIRMIQRFPRKPDIQLSRRLARMGRQVQLAQVRSRRRCRPDLQAPARRADCAAEHRALARLQRQRHRNADIQHRNCRRRIEGWESAHSRLLRRSRRMHNMPRMVLIATSWKLKLQKALLHPASAVWSLDHRRKPQEGLASLP
jgi:hypothetical protein